MFVAEGKELLPYTGPLATGAEWGGIGLRRGKWVPYLAKEIPKSPPVPWLQKAELRPARLLSSPIRLTRFWRDQLRVHNPSTFPAMKRNIRCGRTWYSEGSEAEFR